MYLRAFGYEAWVEIVPYWQPFCMVDRSMSAMVVSALYVSATINKRMY